MKNVYTFLLKHAGTTTMLTIQAEADYNTVKRSVLSAIKNLRDPNITPSEETFIRNGYCAGSVIRYLRSYCPDYDIKTSIDTDLEVIDL